MSRALVICLLVVNVCVASVNGVPCGENECGTNDLCCQDATKGDVCYDPTSYTCIANSAGFVLCGSQDGRFNGACGTICYDSTLYQCVDDSIVLQPKIGSGGIAVSTTILPSYAFGATFTYTAMSDDLSEPVNSASHFIPFVPPKSGDLAVPLMLSVSTSVHNVYLAVVNSVGVVFTPNQASASNAWLQFTTDDSAAVRVAATSCSETAYVCNSNSSFACYPLPASEKSGLDFTLCPCEGCELLGQVNSYGAGACAIELGPTNFPLTVTFSPQYPVALAEDFDYASGLATVTGVMLTYNV